MGWRIDILIALCSSLFCGVSGVIVFRRLPPAFRLLAIHALLAFAMDLWGLLAINVFGQHDNQVYFNMFLPFDFLLMLYATRENFGKHFRVFSIASAAIFMVLWVGALSINGIYHFANQVLVVSGILLTIAYFIVLLRNVQEERSRHTTAIFCIAVPVILYYCCTIPHFGLMHYLQQGPLKLMGYYINNGLSVLRYFFTGVGLILLSRSLTKPAVHAYQ